MSGLVVEYSTLRTAATAIGTAKDAVLCDSLSGESGFFASDAAAAAYAECRTIHAAYATALSGQIGALSTGINDAASAYEAADSDLAVNGG
jgi:hypothetical protein